MPESEPKPKLIELVGPGAGQGWKAVLRNGKAAVVHEIPVPPAEAQAAAPRLQRLYEHRQPSLAPVLAYGTDQSGVWVAIEPNEGTTLGSILSRGPLTPPAAAALGSAVLSGVAALHEAGIAMGGFGATAVRVTSNGEARLSGHPAAAVRGTPSQSDLRADVRSCGMAVCAAFGVDPAGAPAPPNIPPGLVVTMRSMASGAMGPSADRAQAAFREMAAALLAPDRQVAAQSELATRSGGREVPKITPFLPGEGQQPAPAPSTVPVPAAAFPSVPPAPAAPPAFTTGARRDETAGRHPASYDAPDRPLQTYPSMPAFTFPPTQPVPAASAAPPAPPAEAAPAEPKTSTPAVPTWSEAPPRTEPPYEPIPAASTNPPAPAPIVPETPQAPVSPFDPGAAFASAPPAPAAPVEPAKPVEEAPKPAEAAKPSWTPVEAPVWTPGEAIPTETLGGGTPVADVPVEAPKPAPAEPSVPEPEPYIPPTPVRRPAAARPPSRGGGDMSERPPWLVPAAVAVVIVILLGAAGILVFANRGTPAGNHVAATSPTARPTQSPHPSPTSSPSGKVPAAVPSFGPAAADPVTKVQFCTTANPCKIAVGVPDETATQCDLTSCSVEVAMYFSTGQHQSTHYNLKFFDRCTGLTTDLPGPPAYTPPGYAVVIPRDHWQVNIPSGVKSGALVAVTDQPTTAASAPLLLGSQDSCA
ncbi:MAG TPA: hypothetical protein VNA65_02830 [Candidatus Dormibacteraeota bacterium]|nr:hypothetical protein [Candidatus Dormibacteraeota bacterium]